MALQLSQLRFGACAAGARASVTAPEILFVKGGKNIIRPPPVCSACHPARAREPCRGEWSFVSGLRPAGACTRLTGLLQRVATARFMASATTSPTLGAESFLSGTGAVYAEEMYRAWKADPAR